MAEPDAAGRAQLADWMTEAHEALEAHDWRQAFAGYPRLDLSQGTAPWTRPARSVRQSRLVLISSGGVSPATDPPFDAAAPLGDWTFRHVPVGQDLEHTTVSHDHYDTSFARVDRNCVFPLGRLRELADDGEIGSLTGTHFSFCGYLPDWATLLDRFIPEFVEAVTAERPDIALLVPV